MRFRGNQPRTMHFGRIKIGEHYSVIPEATLGPTVREFDSEWDYEREDFERVSRVSRLVSLEPASKEIRDYEWVNESRKSRVREASNQEENSESTNTRVLESENRTREAEKTSRESRVKEASN
jgi:hypothetical protein